MILKALLIALKAHHGQKSRSGGPEVYHPIRVGFMGKNKFEIVVGLLHDVVEDTEVTMEDIARKFPQEIVDALTLLTKKTSYDEYLDKIKYSGNKLAFNVKVNDLLDNLRRGRPYEELQRKHSAALKRLYEQE